MHINKKNIGVFCLTKRDLTDSFNEIKDYLDFNLIEINDSPSLNTNIVLIDSDLLKDKDTLNFMENNKNLVRLILHSDKKLDIRSFINQIELPVNLNELNKKIIQLDTIEQFNKNSSIFIKDYILDKNEKKLKKNSFFIIVTEKEIHLLELLNNSKVMLSKKEILKNIWNYSDKADTHTVETHIYRLRKKILEKFQDKNFITNSKEGYII